MNHLQTYQVYPNIPKSLKFLETLSRNLWWSWSHQAMDLFRRIDPGFWEESGQNPIGFLSRIPQARLEELARDDSFLAHQHRVREEFENRVMVPVNMADYGFEDKDTIAYFSMEFGIHESLPMFAGGLGILAGDHLKAASNMGLPLTGVGLLYRQGYFRQFLDQDGWQQEEYPENDLYFWPLEHARGTDGNEVRISVTGPDGIIHAVVWKLSVGRIPLYLLDANVPENSPADRDVTARLYVGEGRVRLAQEVLLGIGGMRALAAMGIHPKVCHMNEGHSAFSSLERLAQFIEAHHVNLKTALEIIPRTTVFTTHTPVAAGHDEFPAQQVRPILLPFQDRLGTTAAEILSWGQPSGSGPDSPLSMFILGLHMAQHCNGVSRLHGNVARKMWAHVWPDRPVDEIPISHITNGVHIPTWVSSEIALLFERYLGPDWYMGSRDPKNIQRIGEIYEEELWRAHEMSRSRLIRSCREMMLRQCGRRNAPKAVMEDAESALDQDVLTIGFARRFAAYKRATLLLQDPDRLEAILTSKKHPVQIIFAGKAHPKDNEGKELIRRVVQFSMRPGMRQKVLFLEDYGMLLARLMLQGVDVWLNTPRRPFEACGTSGMKAAINGVLNVSILDGWWAEGYAETTGWRIGNGEEHGDPAYRDAVESQALYNVLENDVIPSFYERRNGDAPGRWIQMMKSAMKMAFRDFCSMRMINQYETNYYRKVAHRYRALIDSDAREGHSLSAQHERLRSLWKGIRIETPVREMAGSFRVGDSIRLTSRVHLGGLSPEEVEVELYYGHLHDVDRISQGHSQPMTVAQDLGNGDYLYACRIPCNLPGRFGFTARVTPRGDERLKCTPGLLTWA